jgi:hypothetical protein
MAMIEMKDVSKWYGSRSSKGVSPLAYPPIRIQSAA